MQKGQSLVTLLFFMVISITITSAAVIVVLVNSVSASKLEQGVNAYYVAESGTENALLQLLRNPSYAGETLTVGSGNATITVSGGGVNPYTILSVGKIGNFARTIQVVATYNIGTATPLSITSWKEI